MATSNLTIIQDNKKSGFDLLAGHNPLSFIVEALHNGTAPTSCSVDIYDEDDLLLNTFSCIPYKDTVVRRQFLFISDGIFKAYMEDFDDIYSSPDIVKDLPHMSKFFKLIFTCEGISVSTSFVIGHGVQQFGSTPLLEQVEGNAPTRFIGCVNRPVYLYCYNTVDGADISFNTEVTQKFAADADFGVFIDSDNTLYTLY